jgi:hypothetical protein
MKHLRNLAALSLVALMILAQSVNAQSVSENVRTNEIKEGTRLTSKEQLREVFPDATKIEEYAYVPKQWGGISLMGLISRLMGDRTNKVYEGIDTKRYLYRAFKESDVLGIAHGSTTEWQSSNPFDVFVYYDATSRIKDVRLQRLPENVVGKLSSGGFLQQFVDRDTNAFSVSLGRRGRVKDWGEFAHTQKRPSESELRTLWEKIVRSVRFNAAFVEVAYFISQHPMEEGKTASSR